MMSSVELIVLGILLKKPLNAFELTRLIDDQQAGRILKISKPAIYKCCKRLSRDGYIRGKVTRDGEMPEKVVYTVTSKGKGHFLRLMKHFSGTIIPFYMEFNTFLWNIDRLEKQEALELLRNLQEELIAVKKWIIAHEREEKANMSFASAAIVKQYRMVITTLVIWIEETVKEFEAR
jgi:DNA-binding PadR family transcriptional regulator